MSKKDNSKSNSGTFLESLNPKPVEDRGYTPLSQRPTGQTPTFTPPSGGSGAPSDEGGGSQSEPAGSGGDSGGDEG